MSDLDLPVGLRWVKLVCRLGRLVSDSTVDVDAHPDLLPVGGTLTLTALPSRVRIQEADGRWRSVEVAGRTYTIRADGELVDNEGRVGVYIPDPASPLVEPQGYAIIAAVKPTGGTEWRVTVGGSTVLPDVVDLVAASSVGSVSPNVTASFDARLYALEAGGGGTGSGVQSVSGTVTLGTTPGLYEVYAIDAATVQGVSLVAGDAAVFRYLSGSWSWMIVGQHTTWQAPEPTAVTATAPTFTDADGTANDRYVIPATTGVEYRKGGTTIATGTYTPTAGEAVTITATAQDGYTLTGTATWTHTFSTSTDPISVTATEPTWTDDATNGGGTWTAPTVTGVTYTPASGTATPGQSVTVTATAQPGYVLQGTSSWQHAFPAAPIVTADWGAYDAAVATDAPVHFLKLSTNTDNTGSSGSTFTPTDVTFGAAIAGTTGADFNGTTSKIAAGSGNTVGGGGTACTIEAVITPDVLGGYRDIAGTAIQTQLLALSGGKLAGYFGNQAGQYAVGATTLTAGTTYHVAMTYDGTAIRVYVNGILDGEQARTGTIAASGSSFVIGRAGLGFFDGRITRVAAYDKTLSAATILDRAQKAGLA